MSARRKPETTGTGVSSDSDRARGGRGDGGLDAAAWAGRVQLVEASYDGAWELPALGAVTAPDAVLVRPDGRVAWVGDGAATGLAAALGRWFGPPSAAVPATGA